jgi:cell division protein FtsZ
MAQTDIVILVAGLGGGTGSGIAPYIARLARDAGVLTIAAVTMPFDFEGRRHKTADTAIKRLRCHALLVFRFSNQELARELGDNALMTAIYEVQTLRIALWLRDLLVSRHFDQFHPLAKPSKRGRARL